MYNPTRNTFTKDDLFPKFYNQSVFETFPTNFFTTTFFLDQFFLYQDPQKTSTSIDRHWEISKHDTLSTKSYIMADLSLPNINHCHCAVL